MKKSFFVLGILLLVGWPENPVIGVSQNQTDLAEYKTFAQETGDEIIRILVDKSSPLKDRKAKFRQVLQKRFSLPSIAKFVLARYWHRADESQKARYLDLFEEATVDNYTAQLDSYNDERLEVLTARPGNKKAVIISTRIIRPSGGDPLHVDWHASKTTAGIIKVVDLVINGVSMSITQRSEYGAMVQAARGNLDHFLNTLEARLKSPAPSAS